MIALRLLRRAVTDLATEGDLYLDDALIAYTLEDRDRGLDADMDLRDLRRRKILGATAIPTGRYRVFLWRSPRHGPDTLGLADVPGFYGINVDVANRAEELLGCIAVGLDPGPRDDDWIGRSGEALARLKAAVVPRMKAGEECWLTVDRVPEMLV